MRLRVAALAVGAAAAVAVVYRLDPLGSLIPCPYLALTGLACPGCGLTRAVHFLLHADVATAFSYNPLVFLAVPAALTYASAPRVAGDVRGARVRTSLAWVMVVITLAFWIWRNTPWYPWMRY